MFGTDARPFASAGTPFVPVGRSCLASVERV